MGIFMGTGALMLWLDVAPELDRETDQWYLDEHLPERIDVGGYRRARRYIAVEGSPAYLTLFEADTPAALASEGYLRLVRRISEQSQRIRAGFSNVVRNTFEVRQSGGRGMGGIVGSLRVKPRSTVQSEIAISALDMQAPRLLGQQGIVGIHWLQSAAHVRAGMDSVRAVGQSDATADYVLLIEATRAAEIEAVRRNALSAVALEEMGWVAEAFGIYSLMYEVSGPPQIPAH